MTDRTMNGIPLNEIWEQLGAEFPQEDIRKHPTTKMDYVSVEKSKKGSITWSVWETGIFSQTRRRYVVSE